MTTDSSAADPLALYDELLLAGDAPPVAEFCARYPERPSLAARLEALLQLRGDLQRLVQPAPAPTPAAPRPPNGFQLLRPLGQGGMGMVYLAEQRSPRRRCALKFIRHASAEAFARFNREADIAARLESPAIARVYAFGEQDGQMFLASEYVPGFSLRALLHTADRVAPGDAFGWLVEAMRELGEAPPATERASTPAPVATMVELAIQIALALGHAHERGVVHRDVKPSNIVVTLDGAPKLIDFGIAVAADQPGARVTETGAFVGSFDYAAPEQLCGDSARIGPWSDTYALGATLFEMLTLRTPFECASFADRLARADEPPPFGPRHFNPQISRPLDELVRRALHPRPEQRFTDGRELAEALRRCPPTGQLLSLVPRQMARRLGEVPRATWLFLLAAVAGLAFAGLWHDARLRLAAQQAEQAALSRRAADAVLTWRLEAARDELEACVPPARPPAKLPPSVKVLPPPPAHLFATLVASHERVQEIIPKATFGLDRRTQDCLLAVLEKLELPGVGLAEEIHLVVDLRLRPDRPGR